MLPARTAAFSPLGTRLLALFALLAFALQGLAIQTHLHGAPASTAHLVQASAPAGGDRRDPLDPATCALCQELAHAGAALTPAPILTVLPLDWTRTVFIVPVSAAAGLAPHTGWQSRAPPRA
jgi:hypothetical protein